MCTLVKSLFVVMLCVVLSAIAMPLCAATEDAVAGYPHRLKSFDYKMAWKRTNTDSAIVIDGLLKNIRYPYIGSVRLMVWVIGSDKKVRTTASTFPMPQRSSMDEVATFSLKIDKISLSQGDTFVFSIDYSSSENNESAHNWVTNFTVDALTGKSVRDDASNDDKW